MSQAPPMRARVAGASLAQMMQERQQPAAMQSSPPPPMQGGAGQLSPPEEAAPPSAPPKALVSLVQKLVQAELERVLPGLIQEALEQAQNPQGEQQEAPGAEMQEQGQ